jgi:YD repeat-containing protein
MKNSMKYLIIFGIMGFLLSCGKGTESTPAKVCKLQSERISRQGSADQVTSYEYNAQKQLVKSVESYGSTTSDTRTYTYDANGFLIAGNGEYVSGSARTNSSMRCEYKNNQLSLLSEQRTSNTGTVTTDSYAFEYDAQQKLSKIVYSRSSGFRGTYNFSNDKLIGYISRASTGVETQPYVLENGLIKRINYTASYETYEYDTQGRQIRQDTWFNGRITQSVVIAYEENGKNPEEANPLYQSKGWYDMKVWYRFIGGYNPGLGSRVTYYWSTASNSIYKSSENIHNNVLNARGFPTLINTTQTSFSTTGAVSGTTNSTRTYTHTDCE